MTEDRSVARAPVIVRGIKTEGWEMEKESTGRILFECLSVSTDRVGSEETVPSNSQVFGYCDSLCMVCLPFGCDVLLCKVWHDD